jgi:hypothetical protein
MAQKTIGYVELEWTCPVCHTRNSGLRQTCANCGAPQPKDSQFETPAQTELIKDADEIKRAEVGPDIHCPYCGARNAADAKACHQCGGDLTKGIARAAGQVLGAYQTTPAANIICANCGTANLPTAANCIKCGAALAKSKPQPTPQPVTSAPTSRSCLVIVGIIILLVIVGAIAFATLSFRTKAVVGTVQQAKWTRTISIEGIVPVHASSWRDEIPNNAEIEQCRLEVRSTQDTPTRNSREVCGTPYTVDTGTGIGKVVQDCKYEVYADRCTYTVHEWRPVDTLVLNGAGYSPQWPVATLGAQQRTGARNEAYQCIISASDQTYTYTPQNFEEYRRCQVGSRWELQVNSFGSIMSLAPAQ